MWFLVAPGFVELEHARAADASARPGVVSGALVVAHASHVGGLGVPTDALWGGGQVCRGSIAITVILLSF